MSMSKIIAGGVAAVLTVAGLTACGATDDPQITGDVPTASSSTSGESEAPQSGIVPVGKATVVGDWTVGVLDVEGNADGTIQAANEFNDAPNGQYVLVTVAGQYNGSGTGDLWMDLSYEFVGNDGVVYDEGYQVTPADAEDWPTEARAGAAVQYQIVFDVPAVAIPDGTLLISDWSAWDNAEAEYALNL